MRDVRKRVRGEALGVRRAHRLWSLIISICSRCWPPVLETLHWAIPGR